MKTQYHNLIGAQWQIHSGVYAIANSVTSLYDSLCTALNVLTTAQFRSPVMVGLRPMYGANK